MSNPTPPLPAGTESATRTYWRAILFLSPAFLAWLFSYVLILPTLKVVWEKAGINSSRAQWVVYGSNFLMYNGRLVIPGVVLLFVLLELYSSSWPRYRRIVISCVTFILNAAIFAGMATLCTLATLAAKVLIKTP